MTKTKSAQDRVREWRTREGLKLDELSSVIGDPSGQLQRWESGDRDTLPLRLKVRLAKRTGLPLKVLATPAEVRLAKDLVLIMARDAAA